MHHNFRVPVRTKCGITTSLQSTKKSGPCTIGTVETWENYYRHLPTMVAWSAPEITARCTRTFKYKVRWKHYAANGTVSDYAKRFMPQ